MLNILCDCNAPILADTETSLRRIYVGPNYPPVYTLSISTGKNQSTEVSGALYIPTHEYNYKVITRGDPILHKYYITRMAQLRDYKEKCKYEQYTGTHEFIKGKLERHTGGLEG